MSHNTAIPNQISCLLTKGIKKSGGKTSAFFNDTTYIRLIKNIPKT